MTMANYQRIMPAVLGGFPMRGASANLGNVDKHVMVIAITTPTALTPTLHLLQLVLGSEATQVVHKVRLQRHG